MERYLGIDPSSLTIGAAGVWTLVGIMVVAMLRAWPLLSKIKADSDGSLRHDLMARVAALEVEVRREREECDRRIERIEERHEAAVAELKAEVQVLRHDRNNEKQGRRALLAMLKRIDHPEIPQIVEAIEEMLKSGEEVIAVEKAARGRVR